MPSAPLRPAPALAALWLLTFASSTQLLVVSPILPRIREALGMPAALGGALLAAYGACAMLFALLAGPASDRFGRRATLLVGSLAMAGALWLHAAATTSWALLLVRAVAGAAGGVLGGAAVAYVGDAFPYERRGAANGWVASGFALGQVVGIPVATVLADRWGFRAPFVGLAVVMTAAAGLVAAFVPQPDVPRAPTLALGDAARSYADLLRRRPTNAAAFVYLTTFAGVGLHLAYFPSWLEQAFGVGAESVAWLFVAGGLASVATAPIAGLVSDRVGRKGPIVTSCVLFAATVAATPYLIRDFPSAYPVFLLTQVAAAIRVPATQSLVGALVPAERRGRLLSLGSALGQGGLALGGGLASVLWAQGYAACTWASAAMLLVSAALVAGWVPEPARAGDPDRARRAPAGERRG